MAAVERAQRFNPVSPELRWREAELAARGGDWDRAEEAYREAVRLNPEHYKSHALLAGYYAARGDPEAALSAFREALARNPLGAVDMLAWAPVRALPARFVGEGAEQLGRLDLSVANDQREIERAQQGSEPAFPPGAGVVLVRQGDTTDSVWAGVASDPADVAFVDAAGRVTQIGSLDGPYDEARPSQPYRLAIVANRGFFGERGIGPGSRAVFAPPP
jgi:tetratricopeptide (TPR) repeat protein